MTRSPEPVLTDDRSAVQVALAYHSAWTSKDLDAAMRYVADDVVCDSPGGRLEGAAALRGFMEPFSGFVVGSRVLAAFGDEQTAVVYYDTETVPVPSAPAAELLTVRDGRIAHLRIVFDRAPFDAARRAATS